MAASTTRPPVLLHPSPLAATHTLVRCEDKDTALAVAAFHAVTGLNVGGTTAPAVTRARTGLVHWARALLAVPKECVRALRAREHPTDLWARVMHERSVEGGPAAVPDMAAVFATVASEVAGIKRNCTAARLARGPPAASVSRHSAARAAFYKMARMLAPPAAHDGVESILEPLVAIQKWYMPKSAMSGDTAFPLDRMPLADNTFFSGAGQSARPTTTAVVTAWFSTRHSLARDDTRPHAMVAAVPVPGGERRVWCAVLPVAPPTLFAVTLSQVHAAAWGLDEAGCHGDAAALRDALRVVGAAIHTDNPYLSTEDGEEEGGRVLPLTAAAYKGVAALLGAASNPVVTRDLEVQAATATVMREEHRVEVALNPFPIASPAAQAVDDAIRVVRAWTEGPNGCARGVTPALSARGHAVVPLLTLSQVQKAVQGPDVTSVRHVLQWEEPSAPEGGEARAPWRLRRRRVRAALSMRSTMMCGDA